MGVRGPNTPRQRPTTNFTLQVRLSRLRLITNRVNSRKSRITLLRKIIRNGRGFVFRPLGNRLILLINVVNLHSVRHKRHSTTTTRRNLANKIRRIPTRKTSMRLKARRVNNAISVSRQFTLRRFRRQRTRYDNRQFRRKSIKRTLNNLPFKSHFNTSRRLTNGLYLHRTFNFPRRPSNTSNRVNVRGKFLLFIYVTSEVT